MSHKLRRFCCFLLLLCVTLTSSLSAQADMLNLSAAQIVNAPDVRNWPVTTALTGVSFDGAVTRVAFTKQNGPNRWPDVTPPGWSGPLEYTLWLFVNNGGQWVGSGFIQFWNGRDGSGNAGDPDVPSLYDKHWYYAERWAPVFGHGPIKAGETIGFMVTSGNQRDSVGPDSVHERSNVVTFAATDRGSYTWGAEAPGGTDGNADIVAQAKAQLLASHVDISGPCGALKLTNLVAWNLRPSYGLLHKAGGFRAILKADGSCLSGEQSNDSEGFATDYVIRGRDGMGFDLLGDAGGSNNPQWAGPEDGPDMVARNFANYREPLNPAAYLSGAVTPGPVPTPVPVPQPIPLPTLDLTGVFTQMQLLELHLANISQRVEVVNQQVQESRAENRSFFAAVGGEWKKILTYAAPIVGALYAGRAIGK